MTRDGESQWKFKPFVFNTMSDSPYKFIQNCKCNAIVQSTKMP